MSDISIRGVNEDIFKEFKAKAVEDGMTVGQALNLAMENWAWKSGKKRSILDFKPTNWGKGTERTSEEIDEILYGGKLH